MRLKPEDVIDLVKSLEGKKAKFKPLKTPPSETKPKKLPPAVKKGLETHFKRRLGDVRVHTGGNLREACRAIRAKAFTIGNDIYVAKEADAKDMEFLTHELTHVLQYGRGRMPREKAGKALTKT